MRRLNIVLVLFFCLSLPITQLTSERSGVSVNTYIKKYKTIAIQEMQRLKIPASITLAQGILESNLGKSYLAKKANNHFGIKCHTWQGERAYAFDDGKQSCFRNYRTAKDSFIDHSNFLAKNSRYRKLFKSNDYKSWAKGLSKAGYATDPHYASKLIRVIKRFKLHHYDKLNLSKKIKATLTKQHGVKVAQFNQDMTLKRIAEYYKSDLNRLAYYNDLDPQTSIKANMAVYLQNPHPTGRTYKQQINSVASMYGIKSLGFSPTNKKKDTQKKTTPIQVKRPDYSPTPAIVATPNIRTWNKDTKVNYSKTIWGKNKVRINKSKTQTAKKSPEKLAKNHTQQKKTLVSVPSPQAKTLKT
ncbi:MAG: glycoside hydrolase family 73 protein, partial [Chitinophagales bacterium]